MSHNIQMRIDTWSISVPFDYHEPAYVEIVIRGMMSIHCNRSDVLREAAKVLNAEADKMDGVPRPIITNAPMLGGDRRQTRERNRK